jgi:hypothetical protein
MVQDNEFRIIGEAFGSIAADDAQGWITHAGY